MAKISVCRFLDSAVHIVTFWRKTHRGDLSGGGEHWTRGDLKLLQLFGNCCHCGLVSSHGGPHGGRQTDTDTRDKNGSVGKLSSAQTEGLVQPSMRSLKSAQLSARVQLLHVTRSVGCEEILTLLGKRTAACIRGNTTGCITCAGEQWWIVWFVEWALSGSGSQSAWYFSE